MVTLTWETAADWDSGQGQLGVHHEQPSGSEWAAADVLEKGPDLSRADISAYYGLSSTSTGTANDISGNANDSVSVSGTSELGGLLGFDATDFDGVDDSIEIPTGLISATTDWTISAWINNDNVDNGRFIHPREDVNTIIAEDDANTSDDDILEIWNDGWTNTGVVLTKGSWLHLVFAYDDSADTLDIYKNGTLETSISLGGTETATGGNWLGSDRDGTTENWDGTMQFVGFHTSYWSSSDVSDAYDEISGTSYYYTGKKSGIGGSSDIDVTTTADVGTSGVGAITLKLYEDVGGDGSGANTDELGNSYDNMSSVNLNSGTNTYTLSGFDGGGSTNDYWVEVEMITSSLTETAPTVSSIDAEVSVSVTEATSTTTGINSMTVDTGLGSESTSMPVVLSQTITEVGSATDTTSIAGVLSGTTTESGSGAESTSVVPVFSVAAAPDGFGTVSSDVLFETDVSTDEGNLFFNSASVLSTMGASASEAGAGSAASAASAVLSPTTAEAGSGADSTAVLTNVAAAVLEAGSGTDATSSSSSLSATAAPDGFGTAASSTLFQTVSEATTKTFIVEAARAAASSDAATGEVGLAFDASSAASTTAFDAAEIGDALDSTGLHVSLTANVSEHGSATDAVDVSFSTLESTSETGSATEVTTTTLTVTADTADQIIRILDKIPLSSIRSITIDSSSAKKVIEYMDSEVSTNDS